MKITLSNSLRPKPQDESSLGFGKIFTDYMIIKHYKEGAWGETKIVPYAPISLDPSSACLHYGQEVFEGLKAYFREDGMIGLFRPEENFKRMNLSNLRMGIPIMDIDECIDDLKQLITVDKDWIPKSFGTSLYIRPFIIATEVGLGVHPAKEYMYMVIMSASGAYYANGLAPVKIYVEDEYVRAIKGGTGFAKTGGNYAASLVAQSQANAKGFDQVLWLDGVHRKYIEEVGAMNVFFVLKDKIITPKLSGSILDGVTRKSVIELLKSSGHIIEERTISIDDIVEYYQAGQLLESFGTGTAAVISPIGCLQYKEHHIQFKTENTLSLEIYELLTGIQYGKIEDLFNYTQLI